MTANNQDKTQKCYNSVSCILSVLIIVFVVGAIGWDIFISKPEIRNSIDEIRIEVKDIHQKLNSKLIQDSIYTTYQVHHDSISNIK